MKKKLAVIGSCLSRDVFNSNFVTSWKERFDLVYAPFQTSLLSLASVPVPFSRTLLSFEGKDFSSWYKNILLHELNKDFLNNLLSVCPDNLLIDFYSDTINGVIEIDKTAYITNRPKDMEKNAASAYIRSGNLREIKPLTHYDEYMRLWKRSADFFLAFMKEYLPDTKIIVNHPVFSDTVLNPDGSKTAFGEPNVSRFNEIYREMVSYFTKNNRDIAILDLHKKYYIDPDYIYGGAWIVHYHKSFYEDSINELEKLCKNPAAPKKECTLNLLANGSFRYKTLFTKLWSKHFSISVSDNTEEPEAKINERKINHNIYSQCWFDDIAIDPEGSESYTVCFDAKVDCCIPLSENTLLIIRTFDKEGLMTKNDSAEEYRIAFNGRDFDKFMHYSFTFKPKGKFLSAGIYCAQKGSIHWKNIALYRSPKEPPPERRMKNITEKLLIKDTVLADVNCPELYG